MAAHYFAKLSSNGWIGQLSSLLVPIYYFSLTRVHVRAQNKKEKEKEALNKTSLQIHVILLLGMAMYPNYLTIQKA